VYRRGTRRGIEFPRQALHATQLSLVHPRSGEVMTWDSSPPRDFQKLLATLREDKWV
jgi:23S rRNA pseudouridine1911/1915/1917 synthase